MGVCANQKELKPFPQSDKSKQTQVQIDQFQSDNKNGELLCSHSHEIINMCVNRSCQFDALYCSFPNCPACSKSHTLCQHIQLSEVTKLIKKRAVEHKQILTKMENIQKKMVQGIHQRINNHFNFIIENNADKKYFQLVDAIFYKKSEWNLMGSQAEQFLYKLRESDENRAIIQAKMIEEFQRQIQKITKTLSKLEFDIINQYATKNKIQLSQHSKVEKKNVRFLDYNEPTLDSNIVTKEMERQTKLIFSSLNKPSKVQLLFRASEHKFKARAFHQICDNIPHTLTIMKTQYNKTIVGYTPLIWNLTKGMAQDTTKQSFILSLDLNQKMTLIRPQKSIQCIPSYGPVFGGGCDIAITDDCDTSNKNCTNFPYSYNYQNTYEYNQEAWTALCGVPSGKYFNIIEYQVFRISW